MNIGRRKNIDYSWAIKYGFETTLDRVSDIVGLKLPAGFRTRWEVDRRTQPRWLKSFREDIRKKLIDWSKHYFRSV